MKILAIIGVPGVGKTTFVRGLISRFGGISISGRYGLCDWNALGLDQNVAVLGIYNEGEVFAGTDKLSMAVQPDAERFLSETAQQPGKAIVFEGDRLSNSSFFQHCRKVGELRVVSLKANSEVLEGRRRFRSENVGKEQNADWLAGRESKVMKLESGFNADLCYVNDREQGEAGTLQLYQWLTGQPETLPVIRRPSLLF